MDITDDWLKNGIATVAITGYKGARNAEDREPIREHVVRLDYLRELLKTHSIVPNEPTYVVNVYNKGGSGEFKVLEGLNSIAEGTELVAIGVNDE